MITKIREFVATVRDLLLAAGLLIAGTAVALFFIVRKKRELAADVASATEEAKNEAAKAEVEALAAAGDTEALRKRRLEAAKRTLMGD